MNHLYWQEMAERVGQKSPCQRARVGAVIHRDGLVLVTGYNRNLGGSCECERGLTKSDTLHAEQDAVLYARHAHIDLSGATVHVTRQPCLACAVLLVAARVSAVWYRDPSSCSDGLRRLIDAGVRVARFKTQRQVDEDFFRAYGRAEPTVR